MHQNARSRRTGLPGVLNARVHEEWKRRVQVGVIEDQLRGFAAQFQRHRHDVHTRRLLNLYAGRHGPGEADVVDTGMRSQRGPRFAPQTRHDIERAVGQSGFDRDTREGQCGQACFLGGFQDAGVAHRQRRADGAPDNLHRVIPRHDMAGDTMRLPQGINGIAVQIRDRFAMHLVGGPAVEFQIAGQRHGIGPRLFQRLADVHRFQHGQIVGAVQHHLSHARQNPPPFQRRHPAPIARQRLMGGGDGGVDITRLAARDLRQRLPRRRIFQRQRICGAQPAAADEHFLGVEPDRHVIPPCRTSRANSPPPFHRGSRTAWRRPAPRSAGPRRSRLRCR